MTKILVGLKLLYNIKWSNILKRYIQDYNNTSTGGENSLYGRG